MRLWSIFFAIAIIGTITWLAIFEHNYHPRIYRCNEEVTILQVGESELDFNHPEGTFSIWWQSGRRHLPPGGELGGEVPIHPSLSYLGGFRGFRGGGWLGAVAGTVDLVARRGQCP